jgi:peptide/nickel transport system permease protein
MMRQLSPFDESAEHRAPAGPPRRRRDIAVWLSVGWIVVVAGAAVVAAWLPLPEVGEPVGPPRTDPFETWGGGLALGTDAFGRSNLSRVIYGARNSLTVAVLATSVGLVVGGSIGLVAGCVRGVPDRISSFAVDVVLSLPPLVLLLAFTAVLGSTISTILLALTILVIPTFVRIHRAAALSWSERPFVLAARSYGASELRTAIRHVLPNSAPTLVTYVPTVISGLIIAEGSLSFLGLGVPPPSPSWGGMIADGRTALRTDPFVVLVPAATVFLTVLSLNLIGDRGRERLHEIARG